MSKIADPLAILEHGVAVKAYPNCGYTHRLTDCAREIFHSEGFSADEVVSIKTAQPDFHNAILVKKTPETLSEALMSVEMSIALALTKGTVTLSDWEQEVWRDQDLLQLMAKISVEPFRPINPELNFDPLQPDRLEVELQDGSVLMASCAFPLGAPQNPFTEEQAMEKFLNLLNQGNEGPSMFDQELVDQLASWDQSGDIISLLCPLG